LTKGVFRKGYIGIERCTSKIIVEMVEVLKWRSSGSKESEFALRLAEKKNIFSVFTNRHVILSIDILFYSTACICIRKYLVR